MHDTAEGAEGQMGRKGEDSLSMAGLPGLAECGDRELPQDYVQARLEELNGHQSDDEPLLFLRFFVCLS